MRIDVAAHGLAGRSFRQRRLDNYLVNCHRLLFLDAAAVFRFRGLGRIRQSLLPRTGIARESFHRCGPAEDYAAAIRARSYFDPFRYPQSGYFRLAAAMPGVWVNSTLFFH